MKILFLGDSITFGVGASAKETKYIHVVERLLNCEVLNYGVSGTRIGRQTFVHRRTIWNYDFRLRVQIMDPEADLVFVFGGTNDYGHGNLPLGDAVCRVPGTFCHELQLLIEDLMKKYGKEKLRFILPTRRFGEEGVCCKGADGAKQGEPLCAYVAAMKTVLNEYGIRYLDLYENGFPKPLVNTGDAYTADGVHPNDNGHAFIARKIVEFLKEEQA